MFIHGSFNLVSVAIYAMYAMYAMYTVCIYVFMCYVTGRFACA